MEKDNTAQVTDTCTRHITYVRIAHMCSTRLGSKRVYRNLIIAICQKAFRILDNVITKKYFTPPVYELYGLLTGYKNTCTRRTLLNCKVYINIFKVTNLVF